MADVLNCTVGDLLARNAARHPDRPALIYSDRDLRYSYAELDSRVSEVAKGLLALGMRKGDHIGIWATNVPDWLVVLFATARIGAVLVTVNTSYRPKELEYVLRQSDMKALFIIDGYRDVDYVQTLFDLVPELKTCPKGRLESERFPFLKQIIYLGPKQHRGMVSLADVLALSKTIEAETFAAAMSAPDPHDVINMQYTSGTTGFPKGVMLTHYGIINNGFSIGEYGMCRWWVSPVKSTVKRSWPSSSCATETLSNLRRSRIIAGGKSHVTGFRNIFSSWMPFP